MKSTLDLCQYKALKMKTCNTLNVEHFHSNVHVKESYLTPLDYARAFANTVTENIKRLTESGFYYHTNSDSWYPPTAQTIFSSLPNIKKSKQKNIKPEEAQALRDWVARYGRCVRQRSLRQETTMAKAGTLPEFCYISYATQSHGPVEIDSVEKPPNTSDQESACDNQQAGTADHQDEYESSDEDFEDNTHESSTDETSHKAESFWTPKTYFSLEEVPDLAGQ